MTRAWIGKVAVLTSICGLLACEGPGLTVSSWAPGAVDPGAARTLVLTDAYGRAEARAVVTDVALAAVTDGGWFSGRVGRDRLELADGRAFVADMRADALYARLDVLEWFVETSTELHDLGVDEAGNAVSELVDVASAHVLVAATVANGRGEVLLDGAEIEGVHDVQDPFTSDDEALTRATRAAVTALLADLTPRTVRDFVPFDDRDENERPILELAGTRPLRALAAEEAYAADHAQLAAPVYNRAVILDHLRRYDEALVAYDAAQALHPDVELAGLIGEARAGCEQRRDNAVHFGR